MKRKMIVGLFALCLLLTACGTRSQAAAEETAAPAAAPVPDRTEQEGETAEAAVPEGDSMQVKIGDTAVTVTWEDNESVMALRELAAQGPLNIRMSMYGGFEQVGPIGRSLPRDDEQTTAEAGDIMLYSGSQIVVFYGSNSWSYTRLGRITAPSAEELQTLLGNGDVTITIADGHGKAAPAD